jgi:hypothetical protein
MNLFRRAVDPRAVVMVTVVAIFSLLILFFSSAYA